MDQSAGDSSADDSCRSLTTEDDGLWNTAIGTDVERAKAPQPNGAMGSKQDPITNTPQLEQSPETPEARVSPAGDGMTASPNDERQLMLAPTPATSSAGLVLSGMPGSPSPQVQDVVVTESLPLSHSEAENHSEVSGSTHKPGDLLPGTSGGLALQVEDIMNFAPPPTPPSLTAVERPVVSPSLLQDIVRQLGDPEEEQPEEDGITLDPAEIKAPFRNPDGSEGVVSLWVLGECHDNAEAAARQVRLPVPAYIGSDGQVERRMSPMPKSDGSLLYIPMCEACYDVDNPELAKAAKFYCYHCRSQDKKAPCMFCLKCYIDEHQADALKSDHIVLKFFKPEILSSTEWNMEEPEMNMLLIGQRKDCVFCHGARLLNASLRCNACRIAFCVQCKDDHTDTDHKIIPTSHAAGKKGLDKFEKPLDVGKSFRARNDTVCGNDLDMFRKLDVVPLRMVMEYKPEKEFASGKRPAKILMHLSGAVSAVQRFQQGEIKWGESVFGTRTMWQVNEKGVFYDDPVQHPLFGETLAMAGAGDANIQLQKESTEVTSTAEDELMDIPQYFGSKEATVAAPPRNDLDHSNTDVDYGGETDADTDTRRSKSASTSRSSAPSVERSSRGMDRSSRGKDRSSKGKDRSSKGKEDRRSSDLFFMRYSRQDEVSPIKPGDSVLNVQALEYSTSESEPASCSNSSSRVSAKANVRARGRGDHSRGRGTGRRERGRGGPRGREPSRGRGGSRGGEPSRGRGGSRGRERSRGRDGSRGDESSRQPSSRGRQPPGRSDSNGREFIEPLVPNTRAKKNTPPANQPTIQQAMLGRRQPRTRAVASNAKNRKKNECESMSVEDIEDMNDESESSDSTESEDAFDPKTLKKRKHRESSASSGSSGDSSSSHRSPSPARKKAQRKKAQTQKPPAKAPKVAPIVAKVAASDSRASYHAATSSAPPGRALINSRGDPGAKEKAQKLPTKAAEVAPIVAQVAASSDSPAIDQRPANSLGNPRAIAIRKKAEAQKRAAKAAEVAPNAAKAAAPSLTSAHAPNSKANVEGGNTPKTIVVNKAMLKRIEAHRVMMNSGDASNAQPLPGSMPTKASLKSYPASATVQPDASKAGKETVTEAGKDQVEAESEHTPPALTKQATLPYFTSDEVAVSPKQSGSKEAQVLVDGTISGSTSEPPTNLMKSSNVSAASELQKAINKVRASTKNYDKLTCHQAKSSAEAAIRLCSSFEYDWKRGDSEPALTKYAKAWFVFDPDLNRPKNLIGAGVLRLIAQIGCDIYTCIICGEKFGTSGTQPPFKQCIGRRVLPNGTKMRCCAVSHRDCLKPLEENALLVCMEEKCASKSFGQMQNQFLWHLGRKRHVIANNFEDYHTGEDKLRALDRLAENHMITIMAKYDVLCPVVPSYLVRGTADGPT